MRPGLVGSLMAVALLLSGCAGSPDAVVSFIGRAIVWMWASIVGDPWLVVAVLFARTNQGNALDHPVRRHILQLLDGEYAMAQLADLTAAVADDRGISARVARRHVRLLKAIGLVDWERDGRSIYVCLKHGALGGPADKAAARMMQHPVGRAVSAYIVDHPGTTQSEIVEAVAPRVGVAPTTVKYWVRKLVRNALVPHITRDGRDAVRRKMMKTRVRLVTVKKKGRFHAYSAAPALWRAVRVYQKNPKRFGALMGQLARSDSR